MSWTLFDLAKLTGADFEGNPDHPVTSVADLESATGSDVSFLSNSRYSPLLKKTQAGIICIGNKEDRIQGKNYLVTANPSRTFQQIAELCLKQRKPTAFTGIHPTAIVHESTEIGENVTVGPYAVIDQECIIKDGTVIGPFVSIGPEVEIGKDCILYAHSVVREYCTLGNRVILQPGAVIGSCGFGYTTNEKGEHTKLKQIGTVILEDDVEIGANTTIDRARFKATRISKGTKIDNLVQIAHNVELGPHNILAAQTGIAGSTRTGSHVMMGGQVGIVGHLEIASGTMISTRGGVAKTIDKPGKYGGSPVVPLADHNRTQVHLRKIDSYVKRIEALEKRLQELESSICSSN